MEEIKYIDEINSIKEHYTSLEIINNSIADSRKQYRDFFNDNMAIDPKIFFKCVRDFENSLLIKFYTFVERIVKDLIYTMVEKDLHVSDFVNNFINNKIPEDRFAPNCKYKDIQNSISELLKGFTFIVPAGISEVESFNEIIIQRHSYAHKGIKILEIKNIQAAIPVLYYLVYEIEQIKNSPKKRIELVTLISDLKKGVKKILTDKKKEKKIEKDLVISVREIARKIVVTYKKEWTQNVLLEDCLSKVEMISKIDLRKRESSYIAVFEDYAGYYNIKN
ncbi:hypothetical protein [Enterococcus hirae]|uniref:hypothetical protein n=1 Tax=Enterococcus hirae TaxID=1354 RepID=UPI0009BDFA9A|nr:hypothetical protein [Enterococcus hirae]MBA5267118.1 hypothetical protein [Enterococcus hirae]OQO43898.1 hypothetical protein BH733_13205 [Enterococcus hirae]